MKHRAVYVHLSETDPVVILRKGLRPLSYRALRRRYAEFLHIVPRTGFVYMGRTPGGVIASIGELPRFLYLVDGRYIQGDVEPDEDDVGLIARCYGKLLPSLHKRALALYGNDDDAFCDPSHAEVGKLLLPTLTVGEKHQILAIADNFAYAGVLPPEAILEAWELRAPAEYACDVAADGVLGKEGWYTALLEHPKFKLAYRRTDTTPRDIGRRVLAGRGILRSEW